MEIEVAFCELKAPEEIYWDILKVRFFCQKCYSLFFFKEFLNEWDIEEGGWLKMKDTFYCFSG